MEVWTITSITAEACRPLLNDQLNVQYTLYTYLLPVLRCVILPVTLFFLHWTALLKMFELVKGGFHGAARVFERRQSFQKIVQSSRFQFTIFYTMSMQITEEKADALMEVIDDKIQMVRVRA